METSTASLSTHSTRLGFHYYPDTLHYRESDLEIWLPELKALGASWLVLQSSIDRAIPENFLCSLLHACIEPVITFNLSLANPPSAGELRTLLEAYTRWGAKYTILFDRPNSRSSWSSPAWIQQDLIERFLDRYLPLATLTQQTGLVPVFPPLEPGGNYWDLAFLRSSLESLQKRHQNHLLDNLVLSAYAWTHGHSLNWGAGGPECWPEARPYFTPNGVEDHQGFRIFDWYQAVSQAILQQACPLILLNSGIPGDPNKCDPEDVDQSNYTEEMLAIAHLMSGEYVCNPEDPKSLLDPVPPSVLASNFWLLVDDPLSGYYDQAWYQPEDKNLPIVDKMKEWVIRPQPAEHQAIPLDNKPEDENQHPIHHYLLLPTFDGSVTDWHLNLIHPYVKKYLPTVGFSLGEASMAERVTVIGNEQIFTEEDLNHLRQTGSMVERIEGIGTSIATQLLER
ncbi:MAG: hypothetical protein ABSE06_00035 [Anaerolineaceae bacterium]|jgi:hypothetical protein